MSPVAGLVLVALAIFLLWQVSKAMGRKPARASDFSRYLTLEDRHKHGAIDSEIKDWNLPWRTSAFRRETPPHPEMLRACYLNNLVKHLGAKAAADLELGLLDQVYLLYLATGRDTNLAAVAMLRLEPDMRNRAGQLGARMAKAKQVWDKWQAMQEAYARHRTPDPVEVPNGDLLAQLQAVDPDPDLWHEILLDIDFDNPAHLQVVDWIVSQPECDKATIRSLGMTLNIFEYLDAEEKPHSPDIGRLVRKMMQRWTSGAYKDDALAEAISEQNPKDHEPTYCRTEAEIVARGGVLAWPFPIDFFRRSVGRLPQSRFTLSRNMMLVASKTRSVRKPPAPGWDSFDAAIMP